MPMTNNCPKCGKTKEDHMSQCDDCLKAVCAGSRPMPMPRLEPGCIIEWRYKGEEWNERQMALVTQVIPAPFDYGNCAFMAATYGAVKALVSQPVEKK